LENNQISELPVDIIVQWKKLEEINLSNNPLSSLPNEIGDWKMLKSFFLNSVSIPSLPRTIG